MIAKASAKFVRISPRKVRYVIDLIRQKTVPAAQGILNGSPRRAGGILKKLLNQAVDAAKRNSQIEAKDLVVSRVIADGGPMMKRFRPMSMGRAGKIRKRTSHVHLELDLINKNRASALPGKPPKAGRSIAAPAPKKESGKKKLAGAR
ncbi:MAG: 50S ribosomal protein L22 [Omnitrophica bacterium RIFCSPHIGHO2_02_FULL_51_18]|nr:MAG: 50S ribosomal protein L22 [Omnitrophica bacterium RIFCSPHIGHO2_02_FULL_51_18]